MTPSSSRWAPAWLARVVAALLALGAGCADRPPTSVLLAIDGDAAGANRIYVRILGPNGQLGSDDAVLAPPTGDVIQLPGTVVVELADDLEKVRAVIWAIKDGSPKAWAHGPTNPDWLPVAARTQTRLALVLSTTMPADGDRDEIPDSIDNCPRWSNPKQEEPCRTPDAGAEAGGTDVAAGTDAIETTNNSDATDLPAATEGGEAGSADTPDGPVDTPPDGVPACDPVMQNCAQGFKCAVVCVTAGPRIACVSVGMPTAAHGEDCGTMLPPCATGTACLAPMGSMAFKCMKFCDPMNPMCPAGSTCMAWNIGCAPPATEMVRVDVCRL